MEDRIAGAEKYGSLQTLLALRSMGLFMVEMVKLGRKDIQKDYLLTSEYAERGGTRHFTAIFKVSV